MKKFARTPIRAQLRCHVDNNGRTTGPLDCTEAGWVAILPAWDSSYPAPRDFHFDKMTNRQNGGAGRNLTKPDIHRKGNAAFASTDNSGITVSLRTGKKQALVFGENSEDNTEGCNPEGGGVPLRYESCHENFDIPDEHDWKPRYSLVPVASAIVIPPSD